MQSLIDIGFEVELTGFETPDIDLLLDEALEATGLSPADDQLPVIRTGAAPPVRTNDVRFTPRKRTFAVQLGMSALGQ